MDLVPGFQVLTRQACTLSAGSANPKSRQTAAMDPQSMNFPAHGDNDGARRTSAASAEVGAADPRESRHSRNGQRQIQWRTTSPLARHVLQGPTGSSAVLTHSPFWISKNSAPSPSSAAFPPHSAQARGEYRLPTAVLKLKMFRTSPRTSACTCWPTSKPGTKGPPPSIEAGVAGDPGLKPPY